jgi:hypothetical protein
VRESKSEILSAFAGDRRIARFRSSCRLAPAERLGVAESSSPRRLGFPVVVKPTSGSAARE